MITSASHNEATDGVQELVDQMIAAVRSDTYFLALFAALCVPDICGALSSSNGEASKKKFTDWYQKWYAPLRTIGNPYSGPFSFKADPQHRPALDASECYDFRCGMLHQGRTQNRRLKEKGRKIVFVEPGAANAGMHDVQIGGIVCIDLVPFCYAMHFAYQNWLQSSRGERNVTKNLSYSLKRYSRGYPRVALGVPVIG